MTLCAAEPLPVWFVGAMAANSNWPGVLLLIHALLMIEVSCDYVFEVQAFSYRNDDGTDSDGFCCDGALTPPPCSIIFFNDQCDNRFTFCLRSPGTPNSDTTCPLGFYSTGVVGDDDFFFQTPITSSVPNPMVFTGTTWPGGFQFAVQVFDVDGANADDHVDNVYIDFNTFLPINFFNTDTFNGAFGNSRITLGFRLRCTENFYGYDCATFCVATDDATGHYSCSPTGELVCLSGWSEPAGNCLTPLCAAGCDPVGGYCDTPGTCLCNEGWSGMLCDTLLMIASSTPVNILTSPSAQRTTSILNPITSTPAIQSRLPNSTTVLTASSLQGSTTATSESNNTNTLLLTPTATVSSMQSSGIIGQPMPSVAQNSLKTPTVTISRSTSSSVQHIPSESTETPVAQPGGGRVDETLAIAVGAAVGGLVLIVLITTLGMIVCVVVLRGKSGSTTFKQSPRKKTAKDAILDDLYENADEVFLAMKQVSTPLRPVAAVNTLAFTTSENQAYGTSTMNGNPPGPVNTSARETSQQSSNFTTSMNEAYSGTVSIGTLRNEAYGTSNNVSAVISDEEYVEVDTPTTEETQEYVQIDAPSGKSLAIRNQGYSSELYATIPERSDTATTYEYIQHRFEAPVDYEIPVPSRH